jgi:hypothetical protein
LLLELDELFDELLLLELDELFDELLLLELDELFEELLLLEFEDRLDELLLDRLLLELAELLDDEFDDELAELLLLALDDRLDELLEAPGAPRPPPLRGPLMSERLLLELEELLDDELLDRLLDDPFCRPPRSSRRPTAAAAVFMPRSQPLKKRCTGVSPRGLEPRWPLSSRACRRGAAVRSMLGSWRIPSRREGRDWACTLAPVIRAATAAARARRGCFMKGSTRLNRSPATPGVTVQRVAPSGYSGRSGKRL